MKKDERLVALGQKIRSVRKKKNLSQEEVAFMSGIARSYFGGVERGERNVSAINLIKIAVNLDVEVGKLFPTKSKLAKLE